jgi:valyl-tRNA synthetase
MSLIASLDALFANAFHIDFWVVARNNDELHSNVVKQLVARDLPRNTLYTARQDEDVLDTWFSSGLLPLSASGWTGAGTTAVS